ncbi:Methyltransferase type 11 and Spermine synthase domain containing protein [Aphelenchoides fujianensis]|nr:Methyltransferase type 11 and Spermine synthase domain containing protein [Aphelenchoides fujianensis]
MVLLLPSSQKEFADPTYWKKFFEKCDTAFEWYGDYSSLGPILEYYIKTSDQILQIGCGNSILAEQLYDNGFRNVTSIDTDAKVIHKQQLKNSDKRPELVFKTASAAETGLADSSVNIVVDKGTLDALFPADADEKTQQLVEDIFAEIDRVLQPLGRYVVVTLAQEHIVHKFIEFFRTPNRFLVRVHKAESDKSFSMPVFVFVATKMRSALPTTAPIQMMNNAGMWERLPDEEHLQVNLRGEREFSWLFHQSAGCLQDEVSFTLSDPYGKPRYVFTILDDPTLTTLLTYGVFIVPMGHETDWLFTTTKGRATLRRQCNRHRLLLVHLLAKQVYLSINHIEVEITDLARRLAPPQFSSRPIEFLSLGRMESMEVVAEGESPVNGKWTVEHVKGPNDRVFRRLIFMNSSSLIQSEVEMYKTPKGKYRMCDDFLSCDHHRSMIISLQFLGGDLESTIAKAATYRFLVLGLGGGLLAKFLHRNLPGCTVVGVEYDKAVVKVARGQFGLPKDPNLIVVVDDAYNVMKQTAESEDDSEKFDCVFMDLASSERDESGLACPPAQFATVEAIQLARDCLRPNGVFSMNVVTRDEELLATVKNDTLSVFPNAFVINEEEDVNEVLICPLNYEKQWLKRLPKKQQERWEMSYTDMLQKLVPVTITPPSTAATTK